MSSQALQSCAFPAFVDAAFSFKLESAEFLPSLELIDQLQREQPDQDAVREQIAGGWAMFAGVDSPLSHVIGAGLVAPFTIQDLDRIENFYFSRRSRCEIVVSPYAEGSMLPLLGERGYRVSEWNSVLVREVQHGDALATTDGVEVRRVAPNEARLWAETVAKGFEDVVPVTPELFVPFATGAHSICLLASIDGETVGGAGGSLFPEEGIAAFYGASTLPKARRRGVQNALFAARMELARDAGCRYAVVCTMPGTASQRNAERNGFRLAYTKIAMVRAVPNS